MNFQSVIVALGVLASIAYIVHRLRQEWQLKSTGCGKCPVSQFKPLF